MNILMKGWNLYHKTAMIIVVAFFFSLFLRALVSIDGGAIRSQAELSIEAPASELWTLIIEPENRVRWEAHVIDMVRMSGTSGEEESSHLVFWRTPRMKRWQSIEGTMEVVPERLIMFQRQSDVADRWLEVSLTPDGPCRTTVMLKEHYRPVDYGRRYWAFLESDALEERLVVSLGALERWASSTGIECAEG